jgi:hypothetical protein
MLTTQSNYLLDKTAQGIYNKNCLSTPAILQTL